MRVGLGWTFDQVWSSSLWKGATRWLFLHAGTIQDGFARYRAFIANAGVVPENSLERSIATREEEPDLPPAEFCSPVLAELYAPHQFTVRAPRATNCIVQDSQTLLHYQLHQIHFKMILVII